MTKIKNNKGETIVETLVSMLIVSLSFIMLSGGIVAAAKVNKAARELNKEFNQDVPDGTYSGANFSLSINGVIYNDATPHKTQSGYYYYEVN